jgi:hypothetical protein
MAEEPNKISISLYEFYAMGINTLLTKAPWESGERVSAYHESFLYEQRLLGLTILFLLGEEYIPKDVLKTMPPKYRDQVRHSVNQAVFSRALKHHYRQTSDGDSVAELMVRRMETYINTTREASRADTDAVEAVTTTLARRVPPLNRNQLELYTKRVEKIFVFTENLVTKSLKNSYNITEM